MFTRIQIETMRRVELLTERCSVGEAFVEWLRLDVASSVAGSMRSTARKLADQVASMYPGTSVPGLSGANEYVTAMLYRLQPKARLDDAITSASCERLEQVYNTVRFCGMPSAKKVSRSGQRLDDAVRGRIVAAVQEPGVTHVVVPINFGYLHWASITRDVEGKAVKYHGSLSAFVSALDQLAHSLIEDVALLKGFGVVALNSPIQQDGYSCGLCVLQVLARTRQVCPTNYAQLTRRLEFLHFVRRGSMIV